MDFSALNPQTTNRLSIAARNNDVESLTRLLDVGINPNHVDNRGWTALHEAAAHDSVEALSTLLHHPDTRTLVETFEGHTALYLACQNKSSITTINLLLEYDKEIVEFASNEMVSPLAVVSGQGRLEAVEVLINAKAILDMKDFDGDTPMHEAARNGFSNVVSTLLHAGADPSIRNNYGLTPFHIACFKGFLECVEELMPFTIDLNEQANDDNTPLTLATKKGAIEIVRLLLANDANPDIMNDDDDLPLYIALKSGFSRLFELLLPVTSTDRISRHIMTVACNVLYFSMDIIIILLQSELGPEFFNSCDHFYIIPETIFGIKLSYNSNSPLGCILLLAEYIYESSKVLWSTILQLLLGKGVAVNALYRNECPPLVYLHFCPHLNSYQQTIDILVHHGCNVDYFTAPSQGVIPDAFIVSAARRGVTLPALLTYSLKIDPEDIIQKLIEFDLIGMKVSPEIIMKILPMCCLCAKTVQDLHKQLTPYLRLDDQAVCSDLSELLKVNVPSLKHICRKVIRRRLRCNISTTQRFLYALNNLPIPNTLKAYIRFA